MTKPVLACLAIPVALVAQTVDYRRDVHPILAAKCFACHGGDKRSGGLSLKDHASILAGGRSGAVVVPLESHDSMLVRRVNGEIKPVMPPGGSLAANEIDLLKRWIDEGARAAMGGPIAKRRFVPSLELKSPGGALETLFDEYWAERKFTAPQPVDDVKFARRVYLDLWGMLPSPEQLREFTSDPSATKRSRLVRQLLSHRENYAGHWMSFWNDLLRNEDRFGTYGGDRRSISGWLEGALRDNLPYDKMVRALLDPAPKTGPEGFLLGVNWRGDSSAAQMPWMQAAQNSAQVLLGINLKCNSCHDSFISKWKLRDAYNLASFFAPDGKLELVRCDAKLGEYASPKFLYPELDRPVGATIAERHQAAADLFTDPRNGRLARTIVNRVWQRLVGRGIVEPVDDMDGEPWSPKILDWLSAEFVVHRYDLHWLLETIITSRAYQLPVATPPTGEFVFRGPSVRRMTAEQFVDTLSAITGEWPVFVPGNERSARFVRESRISSTTLTRALGRPFRDQVVTERANDSTTLQALELTNGQELYHALYRGARRMMGQEPAAPKNLFDSFVMRGNTKPVAIDIDVTGMDKIYLVVADAGSYSPPQTKTIWQTEAFGTIATGCVETSEIDLRGKNIDRFRASVMVDPKSNLSDISPAVRFFVFREKPNYERLVPVEDRRPVPALERALTGPQLVDRIFRHAYGRAATRDEQRSVGNITTVESLTDLLWAIAMTPEFQLVL